MVRRHTLVMVAIFLAVLSGCQTTSGPTDSFNRSQIDHYPTGTGGSGIDDPAALLEAHRDVIRETGFVRKENVKRNGNEWNSTYKSSLTERRYIHHCRGSCLSNESNTSYTYYRKGNDVFAKEHPAGERVQTKYTRYYPRSGFNESHLYIGSLAIRTTLESNETQPSRVVNRNNQTFLVYSIQNAQVRNKTANGSIVVREDGLITSFKLTLVGPDGAEEYVHVKIRPHSSLHIEVPSWKSKSVDATTITVGGSSDVCNNDGDQSYQEDNDRDNDGVCDEG